MKGRPVNEQLSEVIAGQLLNEIRFGRYKNINRLPSETEIASYMNVSRTVIRDAFSVLEREGFIGRKRGLGTLINHHVLDITTRIDLEEEFLNLVSNAGYEPGSKNIKVEIIKAPNDVANKLRIASGDNIYKITRVITADKVPVIFCLDYFSTRIIKDKTYDEEELKVPVFKFLDERCNEFVDLDISEIHAVKAEKKVAKYLEIQEGDPVIRLNETGYNFYGIPILFSDEYYREGLLNHVILRKNVSYI